MSFPPTEYLRHMLAEVTFVTDAASGLSKEQFLQDETLKRAFVRSLEIVGEATKQLSEEFRKQHPNFEWRAMAGMRDRLIHNYFGVDYDLVWDVVSNKLPSLKINLEKVLQSLDG